LSGLFELLELCGGAGEWRVMGLVSTFADLDDAGNNGVAVSLLIGGAQTIQLLLETISSSRRPSLVVRQLHALVKLEILLVQRVE